MSKASILCASYNTDRYIKAAIKSVMTQTHVDWEMIIVDDHSKDKTYEIAKRFAKKCPKIKVFRNDKKMGCGSSYHVALSHATGDVCCVLDSDDALSHSKSLAKLLIRYENNPQIDYIWTQFYLCDDKLRILKKGFSRHPGRISLLEHGMKGKHSFSHWRTFRTHLRDKSDTIFKEGLRAAVDKWMGYTLEELGRGGFLPKVLYKYRQRVGGLSFRGRKYWKMMKKEFLAKREKNNIKPFPIKVLE